jgi:hypothetical protein
MHTATRVQEVYKIHSPMLLLMLHTDISLTVSSLFIHPQLAYKGISGAINVTLRKESVG